MQVGVFSPFMRAHSQFEDPDKEPWSFGARNEAANKRTIELRYEILPEIYNAMEQASQTGVPALRPLFLEFPDDGNVSGRDDEFMVGDKLLAAPVLHEGQTKREVYLPKGVWFDYWTGRRYEGGKSIYQAVTLDSIPLFVRGGAFVFRGPIVQSTSELAGKPLRVLVTPAAASESASYEDDGATPEYRNGKFMRRTFRQNRKDKLVTIEISQPEGSYRPAARDLVLEVFSDGEPKNVTLDNTAVPRLADNDLKSAPRGWTFGNDVLIIKEADSFKSMHFSVEY
jgi:alpha-glucosidase